MPSLILVFILAAAASAAPTPPQPVDQELPFLPAVYENRSSFFAADHSAAALARFHSIVGQPESDAFQRHQNALRSFAAGAEQPVKPDMDPEVLQAKERATARMAGAVRAAPSIADVNEPIAHLLYGGDVMLSPDGTQAQQLQQDDIRSREEGLREKRGAPLLNARPWNKSNPIGFAFNNDIDEATKALIRKTTAKIAENTCISFAENKTDGPYLQFHRGGGCWSYLGNVFRSAQPISIDYGCGSFGIIAHETMHALGIDHTQNRKDRDAFVSINLNSVSEGMEHNFEKRGEENENFGVPYDFGSDMHYGSYAFSKDGKPVIVAKDIDYANTMGNRKGPAFNDYKMINLLYKCSEKCPTQISCQNGGYPSPKNCNACVCNDFYTGARCENPKTTVSISTTSGTKTSFETPYVREMYISGNDNNQDMFSRDPVKIIRAPVGRRIRVTVDKVFAAFGNLGCYVGCPFVGMEFIDSANGELNSVGKLFCCSKDQGYSFISKSNVIGYKAYSSPGMPLEIAASYSVV